MSSKFEAFEVRRVDLLVSLSNSTEQLEAASCIGLLSFFRVAHKKKLYKVNQALS